MKAIFRISERFGTFPSNGDVANAFRFTEVETALSQGTQVIFDFADVTNMTSSFCNGLIATLVAHHSEDFAQRMSFTNCDPVIQELIRAAIVIGRREAREFA